MMKRNLLAIIYLLLVAISCRKAGEEKTDVPVAAVTDPLHSWNDGEVKRAIVEYVNRVTKDSSADYIPPEDRIATFDNDGTLWAERPYVQELFAFYQAKQMVAKQPALAKKQPFKAMVEGDKAFFAKGGDKALIAAIGATHTGMTEDEFEASAKTFFASAKYPGKNVPLKQIRYLPQLELLDFLRVHGFKIYICTGGTVELVRSMARDFYGIPPEQIIGTSFKYVYADSSRKIYREPALNHFNDKEGKPVGIQLAIGKHPVLACGNEGGKGDIAMLSFSQAGKYPSLQLLVNHDDGAREFEYSEPDSASLKAASKNHWRVISIKNDWKEVFPKP
ncbi:MAG TPA: HAD family hydrolase [Chryseolinea sp.]